LVTSGIVRKKNKMRRAFDGFLNFLGPHYSLINNKYNHAVLSKIDINVLFISQDILTGCNMMETKTRKRCLKDVAP
jgi:hypothetical protein